MKHIHRLENGAITIGEHPNPQVGLAIDQEERQVTEEATKFEAFMSTVPTQNELYADELSRINAQLEKDGFTPVPTFILTSEDFRVAQTTILGETPTREAAFFVFGRVVIDESRDWVDRYGKNYIIGIGLHEGAHASMEELEPVVLTHQHKVAQKLGQQTTKQTVYTVPLLGGFHKYHTMPANEKTRTEIYGDFWEEGFADSYRVRGMKSMGVAWRADNAAQGITLDEDVEIAYVGKGTVRPHIDQEYGCTYLPIEYSLAVGGEMDDEGFYDIVPGHTGMAAYAIDLLDKHQPGLFEDMKNGRKNPRAYSEFVRKVNAVKPGLYQELRSLQLNTAEFQAGLVKVIEALSIADSPVETSD